MRCRPSYRSSFGASDALNSALVFAPKTAAVVIVVSILVIVQV